MTRRRDPARETEPAAPAAAGEPARRIKRIVVHPDQVSQPDRRPWRRTSLTQVVGRFLLMSAAIVAIGVAILALGLRLLS